MIEDFFRSLFDISFTNFVTTKLIKILFILTMVALTIGYLIITIMAFAASAAAGVFMMFIFGPLAVFFYLLWARVFYELIIVIFRIFENTRDQLEVLQGNPPQVESGSAVTATAPAVPAGRSCPNCGASAAPGDKFCESCGTSLE